MATCAWRPVVYAEEQHRWFWDFPCDVKLFAARISRIANGLVREREIVFSSRHW